MFFALSVAPSLLPRVYVVQGVLSGFSLAIGYGVGVALVWGWQFLELTRPTERVAFWSKRVTTIVAVGVLLHFIRQDEEWQNSIRLLMNMSALESAYRTVITAELILGRKRPSRKMKVLTPHHIPKEPRMAKRKRSGKPPQPQHKTKSTHSRHDKQQRLSTPNPLRQSTKSASVPLVGGIAGLVVAMSRLLDKRIAFRLPIVIADAMLAGG